MFELPGGLRVIERRRVAGELELLHHLLGAAVFAFEQERQVNLELDDLRRLVLIAAGRGCVIEERLETIPRFRVFLFLERDLGQVVLRLAEFRIDFRCLLERVFGTVEILLRQQNLAAQIDGRGLVRIGRVRFVDQPFRRGVVALLKGLLRLLEFLGRDGLGFRRALRGRRYFQRHPSLSGRLLHPADFVE